MLKRFTEIFDTKGRVFGLDALRFVAIILVVQSHSRWMTESFPKPFKALFHGSGILGVELFFVLSGFLIGGILLKQFEKNGNSLTFQDIKHFWIRRWFRTLPNYFLILLVYIAVYHYDLPAILWRYFFFTQNIFNTPPFFFEESWSLSIEEISYLVSPLVLALSALLFSRKASLFLWTSILLITIVTALRWIYSVYFLEPNYKWVYMLREVALIRLDSIYYGFIAVYISKKAPELWKKFSIPTFIVGLIGVVLIMKFENNMMEYNPSHFNNTIFFSLLSISIALLLPYLSQLNEIKFTFLAKLVTGVSIISYSLYLINGGLLAIQFDLLSNKGAGWSTSTAALMYVFYWALCLVLSTLLYVFFEKPFTKLRDKF